MEYSKVLGSNAVSCRVASAAMAMVTAKTEENYHMVGFSDKLVPIKIHTKMRLDEVCRTISKVSKGYLEYYAARKMIIIMRSKPSLKNYINSVIFDCRIILNIRCMRRRVTVVCLLLL